MGTLWCQLQHLNEASKEKLLTKFPENLIPFIFFSNEKVFTVWAPDSCQHDCLDTPRETKKRDVAAHRLLRTFTKSAMVSVAVSKLGRTKLIFVEPGVKADIAYHRDALLSQQTLPSIRQLAANVLVFQQDSASAHQLTSSPSTCHCRPSPPGFIPPDLWPPNSSDLNPADYRVWSCFQDRVYQKRMRDVDELKQRLVKVRVQADHRWWCHCHWMEEVTSDMRPCETTSFQISVVNWAHLSR